MAKSEYAAGLAQLTAGADLRVVLADSAIALPNGPAVVRYDAPRSSIRDSSPHKWRDDEVMFVQHSSGSAARPKGCELTANAVRAQLRMLTERVSFSERDTIVSWLPLSHDMGLFGALLMPFDSGARLALGSPERFVVDPGTWLEDCATFGATVTLGPNFAVDLASRVASRRPPGSLGALRMWVVGAEHTRKDTLPRAAAALAGGRAVARTVSPAYGLAEATLGVTMHAPGDAPRMKTVDVRALAEGRVECARPGAANAWTLVSAGRPLAGTSVRIEQDLVLPGQSAVGEVIVRSPSLARGYRNDVEATRAAFVNDEMRTGDQGFLEDGLLYLTGRLDDLLLVNGRSVPAEAVEARIVQALGAGARACAVVQAPDTGRLALLIEPTEENCCVRALTRAARAVVATFDFAVDSCSLVARGQMPRTTSGKLRRGRCRELAFDETALNSAGGRRAA